MRVNVYAEELHPVTDDEGDRVFLHKKRAENVDFEHHGIRMLFGFKKREIHTRRGKDVDDDSPAVTFWFSNEHERYLLVEIFRKALEVLEADGAKHPQ
jgi:hypothetical protein